MKSWGCRRWQLFIPSGERFCAHVLFGVSPLSNNDDRLLFNQSTRFVHPPVRQPIALILMSMLPSPIQTLSTDSFTTFVVLHIIPPQLPIRLLPDILSDVETARPLFRCCDASREIVFPSTKIPIPGAIIPHRKTHAAIRPLLVTGRD